MLLDGVGNGHGQQQDYGKSRQRMTMQQTTNNRSSKGRRWLVMRPSEGSGQRLVAKACGNTSIDGHTMARDDKSGWWQWTPCNNLPTTRAAKGKGWLVMRQPEGSG
jgi:hypothetical protein